MDDQRRRSGAAVQADPRWAAVAARDCAHDGRFFYAVRSTGIYCRPSCPARRPKPEQVVFHATAEEAEQAGYRACLRCKPKQPKASPLGWIERLCRYIEAQPQPPTLAALAAHAGMSPFHLQRTFKAATGLTPAAYARGQRAQRVHRTLARAGSVTDAIYEAGFGSSGRFYETSANMLGMTPGRYRQGGVGTTIRYATGRCSLGSVLAACSERGLCAIFLGDHPGALVDDLKARYPAAKLQAADAAFAQTLAAVVQLIDRPALGIALPLDIRGTAFQQRVWAALRALPVGGRISYAELAQWIGRPRSVRAVASACAANPLAVAVPCHRVVGAQGQLKGYRWGVERKRALLERERREEATASQPAPRAAGAEADATSLPTGQRATLPASSRRRARSSDRP